ncbi:Malonyl CoA-acyl carrier protein transacylase [Glycine max]|nr:Malonyl CoA-acyl carrier protein transacylase [Glycine max]
MVALCMRKNMDKEMTLIPSLGSISGYLRITTFPVLYHILKEFSLLNSDMGRSALSIALIGDSFGALVMGFLTDMFGIAIANGPVFLGLVIPDGPRVGATIVQKTETIMADILLPFSFIMVGSYTDFYAMSASGWSSLEPLIVMVITGYVLKFFSTWIVLHFWRMPLREGLTLSLTLSLRGHIELILFVHWMDKNMQCLPSDSLLLQPAIYVTSLAAVELLRARDGGQQIIDSVDVTCGLSLGEYTALAFAGAFSFEDGLKLVKLRGEAMQDAANAAKSAMVSVIGLDSEKVQQLCDAANQEVPEAEKVQIANYLCPGNYAVSGGLKGVEVLESKAKSFKARMTVHLAVAGAFHTSFMKPAVSRLEAALATTEIRTPRIPVISNVNAQPHTDPDSIKKILACQVTSPVQWETTVQTLLTKGLKKSYELGPGKVIAGIIKRTDKGSVCHFAICRAPNIGSCIPKQQNKANREK